MHPTQDGFIHLTADPKFLLGIGNHFYKQVRKSAAPLTVGTKPDVA